MPVRHLGVVIVIRELLDRRCPSQKMLGFRSRMFEPPLSHIMTGRVKPRKGNLLGTAQDLCTTPKEAEVARFRLDRRGSDTSDCIPVAYLSKVTLGLVERDAA